MSTILIIGGSSGIGKELAIKLSQKDHKVFASFFKNQEINNNSNLNYFSLNVLDQNPDFSFLPEHLDGLVYCPGSVNLKPFSRISPDDFVADYELQVIGAIKTIQAALPRLRKSENASIVLFSTVAVQMGFNFHSQVAASKGAVEGLMRSLAAEFAPKIRVNCIAPSLTETSLTQSLLNTDEKRNTNAQRHPLKRIGSSRDIAGAAEFLLSEASSWISGQVLSVDGGMSRLRV